MDDLKLYARNDNELEGLLQTVKCFSEDIGMKFNLDKCAKATVLRGSLQQTSSISLDPAVTIKDLEQGEAYKYLGVNESEGIHHKKMKEIVRKEYYRRVRLVLKTELNSQNRIMAINNLAIPVVQYSFNILNWTLNDIRQMDSKTRKLLSKYKMHHPKADVDRLYIPRKEGGRGLIQLELSYKTTTIGLLTYMETTNDWMIKLVKQHENRKKKYSIIKEGSKYKQHLHLVDSVVNQNRSQEPTIAAKDMKKKAKDKALEQMKQRWQDKPLHGQYPERANKPNVDKVNTHRWLRASGLKSETEGFILAAQDQSLFTRNFQANIIHNNVDPKCRFCDKYQETIDHLISGCSILAPNEYKNRHDRVGQYLHWTMCKHFGKCVSKHWYEHRPAPVTEIEDVTILWDYTIHTDRKIEANRPDIIVKNQKEKTCLLIDMACPADCNIATKEFEKLSKYKDLEIEIEKMWKLKTRIIPVVIGALGIIKNGTKQHIERIPGNPSLRDIQKIVLLSTAHTLRRTLSM